MRFQKSTPKTWSRVTIVFTNDVYSSNQSSKKKQKTFAHCTIDQAITELASIEKGRGRDLRLGPGKCVFVE